MLGTPFRARTAHVVKFGPVAVECLTDGPPQLANNFCQFTAHGALPNERILGDSDVPAIPEFSATGLPATGFSVPAIPITADQRSTANSVVAGGPVVTNCAQCATRPHGDRFSRLMLPDLLQPPLTPSPLPLRCCSLNPTQQYRRAMPRPPPPWQPSFRLALPFLPLRRKRRTRCQLRRKWSSITTIRLVAAGCPFVAHPGRDAQPLSSPLSGVQQPRL